VKLRSLNASDNSTIKYLVRLLYIWVQYYIKLNYGLSGCLKELFSQSVNITRHFVCREVVKDDVKTGKI